jgi:hypothetical protein
MAYSEYIKKLRNMNDKELLAEHERISKEIKKEEHSALSKRDYKRLLALRTEKQDIYMQRIILKNRQRDFQQRKRLK